MQMQLERHCHEALHAQSLQDLLRKRVEFSEDRGFARVSATAMEAHSPTLNECQFVIDGPTSCVREFEDIEGARVAARCRRIDAAVPVPRRRMSIDRVRVKQRVTLELVPVQSSDSGIGGR